MVFKCLKPLQGGRYMSEKREWEKHMSDKNDMSDKTHMNIWVIKVIESDSEK